MELNFSKGIFTISHPIADFRSLLGSVPTSKWIPGKTAWKYNSCPESKKVLLLFCQSSLVTPTEAAKKELINFSNQGNIIKAVRGIKQEDRVKIDVPLKVQLYEHQKKAYKIGTTLDQLGLLMEQGTGKTLSALAIAGYRYNRGEVKKLLIVAPKSTLKPWKQEILNHVEFPVEVINLGEKKGSKNKVKVLNEINKTEALQIMVINYESVWRIYPDLVKWAPDMIIADESQEIKNPKSKQSKAMHKLGDITPYKQILTGTPITQGPLDVWSQYRFLNPDIFGKSFYTFRDQYAIMGGFKGYQVVKYRNLDVLARRAHSIAYRVRKSDTDIDLPPIVNQDRYTDLGIEAKKYYRSMDEEFRVVVKNNKGSANAPIVLTQLLRLQQITGGFLPVEDGKVVQVDNSKLELLNQIVQDFPEDKKVVIFARFLPEIEAIKEVMKKLGRTVLTLTGKTKDRGGVISVFQNDPTTTVLVAQIQTGGVGLNLQVADTVIFYSTTFSFGDYDQAKARIHRIGQRASSVTYIHLLIEGSIDEQIIEALKEKKDVATYIVDELNQI